MTKNIMKFQKLPFAPDLSQKIWNKSETFRGISPCSRPILPFSSKVDVVSPPDNLLATISSLLLYLYLQPTQPSQYIKERPNFLPNPVIYATNWKHPPQAPEVKPCLMLQRGRIKFFFCGRIELTH